VHKAVGVFRITVVALAVLGVVLQAAKSTSLLRPFVMFTTQSNLLLAACFAYAAWLSFWNRPAMNPLLKGGVTIYILITALVYNLVLAGRPPHDGPPPRPATTEMQRADVTPPQSDSAPAHAPAQGLEKRSSPTRHKPYSNSSLLLHIVVPLMAVVDWLAFDPHRRFRWRYART